MYNKKTVISIIKTTVIYILLVAISISIALNILGIAGKLDLKLLGSTKKIETITETEIIREKDIKIKYIEQKIPLFYDADHNEWQVFEVTGYSLNDPDTIQGTNDTVATGIDMDEYNTRHIPVIAVDPEVIPLYSIVEIEGQGAFIALDTGGMIKGNRIDILFPSKKEALEFGRKNYRVRIIN